MNHPDALKIAQGLAAEIAPACERCEIAGGVRRGKANPHDIELMVLPINRAPRLEFGMKIPPHKTMLERRLWHMEQDHLLKPVNGGEKLKKFDVDPEKFGVKHVNYMRFELFIVTPPAEWGPLFTIRTGPSEFSNWIVTAQKFRGRMPEGYIQYRGAVWPGYKTGPGPDDVKLTGDKLPMPEEMDYLNFLGLGWIEPKDRYPAWTRVKGVA